MSTSEAQDLPLHPLRRAIFQVHFTRLLRELGVSRQAVFKWLQAGRMPRTEWTGETTYSETIEVLTAGAVTKAMLLAPWPKWEPAKRGARAEPADGLREAA
jgi:hypothetical protein